MDKFVIAWIGLQMIIIGLAGGVMWREEVKNGCVDVQQSTELGTGHYILPVIFPLVFTVSDSGWNYCE